MEILVKICQFLLSLSLLVLLHEAGHFVFAKLFKTRVEKFYIFFNAGFSLFKFKKGETEYGIGWIPLGGYVKISGMIDESMDKEQMKLPPKPYEFRSKPAWQRLFIMLGGVLVNFILAFFIYIMVLFAWGEQYLPAKNAKYGVVCDSLVKSIGINNGDIIYALDNKEVERFSDIIPNILLNSPKTIQIIRDGKHIDVEIPSYFASALLEESSKGFKYNIPLSLRIPFKPFIISEFGEKSILKDAGAVSGDEIIAINGKSFNYYDQFKDYLIQNKNKTIDVSLLRNGDTLLYKVVLGADALLGVGMQTRSNIFEFETKKYSFAEAIPAGINLGVDKLSSYLKQFKLLFAPETKAYKSLGGFISIGNIFPGVWDWQAFWHLTAFLSLILAIMNILPIPALDGGHVLFLLYEIISGKKPGDKFLEYAQICGMFLLLGLLILANANDIIKLFN